MFFELLEAEKETQQITESVLDLVVPRKNVDHALDLDPATMSMPTEITKMYWSLHYSNHAFAVVPCNYDSIDSSRRCQSFARSFKYLPTYSLIAS